MEGTCPRCGGATAESRWCPTCGKELTGKVALPTPEAAEAARREAAWLEAHPDVADAEAQAASDATRQRAQAEAHMQVMRADPPADPRGRARTVRAFLWAHVIVAAIGAVLSAVYLGVVTDESSFDGSQRDGALAAIGLAWLTRWIIGPLTAGFFIAWLHRVYKNVRGLGATDLRHGEGWAIGGWFVPILWWFRPKEIVNDTWRASDPALGVYAARHEWEHARVPAMFLAWWLLWCVWGPARGLANLLFARADTLDAERGAAILTLCTELMLIAAALLAIRTVAMVTERQNERAVARERMAPPPEPAARV